MSKEQELRAEIERLQAELEAVEQKQAGAAAEYRKARNAWRLAVPAAEIDGDQEAAAKVAVLQAFMAESDFADQRSELVASELKRRIKQAEGELERWLLREKPMKYFRRTPETSGAIGPLTNWAMALAGKMPVRNSAGAWQQISEDRLRYELQRDLPISLSEVWRLLRSGEIVHGMTFDYRAEADSDA